MTRYRVARLAEADLLEIWMYIARDNLGAADRQVSAIQAGFETLAFHPGLGEARAEFCGGEFRRFSLNRYAIYYRQVQDGIEIARVIHGARDVDP